MRIHSSSLYFPPAGLKQQQAQTGSNASRNTSAGQPAATENTQTQQTNAKRPVQQVTDTAAVTLNTNPPTSSKSSSDLIRIDLPPSAVPPASFLYTHRDDEIAFLAELDSTGTLIYEKNSVANADENSDRPTIISLLKEQQQQPLTPLRSEAIQSYHIRAFLIFRRKFGEKVHKIEYFYEFL